MEEVTTELKDNNPDVGLMVNLYNSLLPTLKKADGVLDKCKNISWDGSKGLNLLDVKNDSMFSYLTNVVYFMLKKTCGESIDDDETRERLAYYRLVLEKVKPIEDKIRYQIDKMVKAGVTGENNPDDKSSAKANLDDLEDSDNEENEVIAEEEGAHENEAKLNYIPYRPSKIAPVPYDEDNKKEKEKKRIEKANERIRRSIPFKEFLVTQTDAPEEISLGRGELIDALPSERKRRQIEYEEENFIRIPQTKKEKHSETVRNRQTERSTVDEILRFTDYSDFYRGKTNNKRKKHNQNTSKKAGHKKRRSK